MNQQILHTANAESAVRETDGEIESAMRLRTNKTGAGKAINTSTAQTSYTYA